jgi:tetratricopeptide (TPR) repeat protein
LAKARALQEESLAQRRLSGNKHGMAANLASLSYVAMSEENLALAQVYAHECLFINRELQNHNGVGIALLILGQIVFRQGEYESAHHYYRECLELSQKIRDESLWPQSLFCLAITSLKQGDLLDAEMLLKKCIKLFYEYGMRSDVVETLEYLALLATLQHRPDDALTLAGAANALRRSGGYPRVFMSQEEYEEMLAQARQALDPQIATAAWRRGEDMPLDQVIALASPSQQLTQGNLAHESYSPLDHGTRGV